MTNYSASREALQTVSVALSGFAFSVTSVWTLPGFAASSSDCPVPSLQSGQWTGGLYCSFMWARIHSRKHQRPHGRNATGSEVPLAQHLGVAGGPLSRCTIANEKAEEVRSAFLQRPHLVDTAQGFLGMDVMSPIDNPAEIWLVTRRCDEKSYQNRHQRHQYHESHGGIPKELKLVPGTAIVRLFQVFAT